MWWSCSGLFFRIGSAAARKLLPLRNKGVTIEWMAYRLNRREPIPDGVRRIAAEELNKALKELADSVEGNRDGRIHGARKSLRKLRVLVRLVQTELGRSKIKRANRYFRDAGRPLSRARDAEALVQTAERLRKRCRGKEEQSTLGRCCTTLRRSARKRTRWTPKCRKIVVSAIRAAERQVEKWDLRKLTRNDLLRGLRHACKRAGRAFCTASASPNPENLHNWRKRVRDHWYQIRILESLSPGDNRKMGAGTRRLSSYLGECHDLVLLRRRIKHCAGKTGKSRLLKKLIDARHSRLTGAAFEIAERIYTRA
jgi:CHAD domain-containing protein